MIYDTSSETWSRVREYYTPPGMKSVKPGDKKGKQSFEPAAHVVS